MFHALLVCKTNIGRIQTLWMQCSCGLNIRNDVGDKEFVDEREC